MFKVTGHWFWIWKKSSSSHLKHVNSDSCWWAIKYYPNHHVPWDKNSNFQKDVNILSVESSPEDALTSRCLGKISAVAGVRFCPACLRASIFKSARLMSNDPFRSFYPAHTSKAGIIVVSLNAGRWHRFHGHEGSETSFDLGVSACQQRPPPSRPPHVCSPDPLPSASSLARHTCVSVESGTL